MDAATKRGGASGTAMPGARRIQDILAFLAGFVPGCLLGLAWVGLPGA
jgi:hypothetical protein